MKLSRSNKFIISVVWIIIKYTENWENIAILVQQILDVRGTSLQRKMLNSKNMPTHWE